MDHASFRDAVSGTSDGNTGWLETPAVGLGRAAARLARRMDHLSQKINQEGLNGSSNAHQSIQDSAQLQVITEQFTQLMSALAHVIKLIGEAQARMNRL